MVSRRLNREVLMGSEVDEISADDIGEHLSQQKD